MKRLCTLAIMLCLLVDGISAQCGMAVSFQRRTMVCYGGRDSVTAIVSGGVQPYTYKWSNNTTKASAYYNAGNIFRVTVTDNQNCTAIGFDTLKQAAQMHNTNVLTLRNTCSDSINADLQVNGFGGSGPLTYSMSGFTSNSTGLFTHLLPGSYTFIMSDTLGCTQAVQVTVPAPLGRPKFDFQTVEATCPGTADGRIIIMPPTDPKYEPLSYAIDSSNYQNNNYFIDVPAGVHQVRIRYFFSCPFDTSVTVPLSPQVCTGITEAGNKVLVFLYPNPATNKLAVDIGYAGLNADELRLEIANTSGQLIYAQPSLMQGVTAIDISGFAAGLYFVLLKKKEAVIGVSKFAKE